MRRVVLHLLKGFFGRDALFLNQQGGGGGDNLHKLHALGEVRRFVAIGPGQLIVGDAGVRILGPGSLHGFVFSHRLCARHIARLDGVEGYPFILHDEVDELPAGAQLFIGVAVDQANIAAAAAGGDIVLNFAAVQIQIVGLLLGEAAAVFGLVAGDGAAVHLDGAEALPGDVDAAAVAGSRIVFDLAGVQGDCGVGAGGEGHIMDNAHTAAVFSSVRTVPHGK